MLTGKQTLLNREAGRFNLLVNETKALSGENDEDWLTRVKIVYKCVTGTKFKHKSAWLFLKDKHKWKNPNSTNARRNRGWDEEPELYGDDELSRLHGVTRLFCSGLKCSTLHPGSGMRWDCIFNKGAVHGIVHCSTEVASEQDELPSSVELDFRARLNGGRMVLRVSVTEGLPPAAQLLGINGFRSCCDGILKWSIKDLDLEPKDRCLMTWYFLEKSPLIETTVHASERGFSCDVLFENRKFIAEFCSPSRSTSVLHQLDGVGSKRYHIVPFGELNGVPVAFVAGFCRNLPEYDRHGYAVSSLMDTAYWSSE
ncbi:hypothetical protein Tco_0648166 [Tanacetum coccineum]